MNFIIFNSALYSVHDFFKKKLSFQDPGQSDYIIKSKNKLYEVCPVQNRKIHFLKSCASERIVKKSNVGDPGQISIFF